MPEYVCRKNKETQIPVEQFNFKTLFKISYLNIDMNNIDIIEQIKRME